MPPIFGIDHETVYPLSTGRSGVTGEPLLANQTNHLIDSLPRRDRLALIGRCEPVELKMSIVLAERGTITQYVYFPVTSFISLVTQLDHHPGLEVGMIGSEGLLGAHLALGMTKAPLHAVVQGSGSALRMGGAAFRLELKGSLPLRNLLDAYLAVLMAQLAQASGCLRFHSIGSRLARWLLMSHDRAPDDTFLVTHEFLAYMLGVRRVGITQAAGALQRSGLIAYRRGKLTIIDRLGLQAAACSCYASNRRSYADLLPKVELALRPAS